MARPAAAVRRPSRRRGPAVAAGTVLAAALTAMGCDVATSIAGRGAAGALEEPVAPPVGDPNAADATAADANTAAPPASAGPFALVLEGTGFTPHVGQALAASLIDADSARVGIETTTVAKDGSFSVSFPAKLEGGKSYTVAYYADVNANGACNAPPTDHSWEVSVAEVSADVTLPVTHNAMFVPVCDAFGDFSLTFDGVDFSGHAGQTLFLGVVDATAKGLVGEVKHAVIPANGQVTLGYPTLLLRGHAYTLAYFADRNPNKMCDASDHAWMTKLPAVAADVTARGDHNLPQVNICSLLPTGLLE